MSKTEAWYVSQRAEALAMMYLTRRDDLVVSHPVVDSGIDFVVQLLEDGAISGRMFGIQLKAADSSDGMEKRLRAAVRGVLAKQGSVFRDLPFPVCLFFFAVDKDIGYYAWLVEPAGESGALRIATSDPDEFRELNDESIDRIITGVRHWYAAKHAGKASG